MQSKDQSNNERYDKQQQKAGERPSDDQKIDSHFTQALQLELNYFKGVASAILGHSIHCIASYREGPTSGTWEDYQLEIQELLTGLKQNISAVRQLNELDATNEVEIFKQVGQLPRCAREIEHLITRTFGLAEQILTTSHTSMLSHAKSRGFSLGQEYEESYQADIDHIRISRSIGRAALRLFYDHDAKNPAISVLDLLAGCALTDLYVVPEGSWDSVHESQRSHQLGMRSQFAACGVSTAVSCVRETFENLFEVCLRSQFPPDVNEATEYGCAYLRTIDIFNELCRGSDDPRIVALHALAAESKPVRGYEVPGGVVISFVLPQLCGVFDEAIKKSLNDTLTDALGSLELLKIGAHAFTSEGVDGYEVGVRLQISSEQWQQEILDDTHKLLQIGVAVADAVDPSPISFWIQDEGAPRGHGVGASLSRSFFNPGVSGNHIESNERLDFVVLTLRHALTLFGAGAQICFYADDAPEDGSSPDDFVGVSHNRSHSIAPLADDDLAEVSKLAELLSSEPLAAATPELKSGATPSFQSPASWMASKAVVDELVSLSNSVVVEQLNLFDFHSYTEEGTPEEGARMLHGLNDAITLYREQLAPFSRPHLTVLPFRDRQGQGPTAPFYLTTKGGELCATGTLSLDGADTTITILPQRVVEKFGCLVDAILDSQAAIQSQSGPWIGRLHAALMNHNFGLSERITNILLEREEELQGYIPSHEVVSILCEQIATSRDFKIVENICLEGKEPLTLAIITPSDRRRWNV